MLFVVLLVELNIFIHHHCMNIIIKHTRNCKKECHCFYQSVEVLLLKLEEEKRLSLGSSARHSKWDAVTVCKNCVLHCLHDANGRLNKKQRYLTATCRTLVALTCKPNK
jgi:hypothetical protein